MANDTGQFYAIEVNTSPGMTNHSLFPMAAKKQGISFKSLVNEILYLSLNGQSL